MDRILDLYRAGTRQIPFERTTDELSNLVSGQPHQGVVLEVSPLEPEYINELDRTQATDSPHRNNALWIALDEIQDPQNLGAIIRSCVYFGVDGIVVTDNRSAPLNATVSKSSAGALEIAPIYFPGNISRFLEGSKNNGWTVIGTSLESGSRPADAASLPMDKPTILVLGNEATGLREKIKGICDYHVRIDAVAESVVSSLNVSVAAALLVHTMASSISNKKTHKL